jgi:hypothetical protein
LREASYGIESPEARRPRHRGDGSRQTLLVDGGLNLKWTHLGSDNTSLFLKDENFRAAIKR